MYVKATEYNILLAQFDGKGNKSNSSTGAVQVEENLQEEFNDH